MELYDEILEKINVLKNNDKIELLIDIMESLESQEIEKAKNEIKKDDGFHNPTLKKLESNIDYFKKIKNILYNEIY